MYKTFFELQECPFNFNADTRYLFPTRSSQEALAGLNYAIQGRKGFALLTGEVGTGKTTLLNLFLDQLRAQEIPTAFIFNSRLNTRDLFEYILADFGIPHESREKSHRLMRLNQWALERYRCGKTTVIVVDEAQNLSLQVLEEIRLLANLETTSEKLLQIVLSGQPELEEKLKLPELRQLRQRIALRCRTNPLSCQETHGYIAERLRIAGSNGEPVFSEEAMDTVYRYSRGIPRVVNLLCEHALINAFADQQRPVLAPAVEEAARDFELDKIAPAAFRSPTQSGRALPSAPDSRKDDPAERIAGFDAPAVTPTLPAAAVVSSSLAPKPDAAPRAAESASFAPRARPSPDREANLVSPPLPNPDARPVRAESQLSSASLPGGSLGVISTRSTFTPSLGAVGVSRNIGKDSSRSKKLILATAAVVLLGLSVGGFWLHRQAQAAAPATPQAVRSPEIIPAPTLALLQSALAAPAPIGLGITPSGIRPQPQEVRAASLRRSVNQLPIDAYPAPAPPRRATLDIGTLRAPTPKNSVTMISSEPPLVLVAQASGLADPGLAGGLFGAGGGRTPQPPIESPVTSVGGRLQAPKLVSSPPPNYPRGARTQRVQGVVVVDILVDVTGKVTEMAVVSGHPLLRDAALTALRNWIYEPARLNGQPVAVHEKVSLRFALN